MAMRKRRSTFPVKRPAAQKRFVATVTGFDAMPGGDHEMVVSTPSVDRDGDRVFPEGMDATTFNANPCLIWAHDYRELPIGTVTGLTFDKAGIRARFKFLQGDEFAARVENAWNQGVIRAASIGFTPMTWTETETGYDITSAQLLEISLCPVPANPEAIRQLKSLGVIAADDSADHAEPPAAPESVMEKRGRVISTQNEAHLRNALAAINELLAQCRPEKDDAEDDDMTDAANPPLDDDCPPETCANPAREHDQPPTTCDTDADVLKTLTDLTARVGDLAAQVTILAQTTIKADDPVVRLVDPPAPLPTPDYVTVTTPRTVTVTPDTIRTALTAALTDTVDLDAMVDRAIRKARGRLD